MTKPQQPILLVEDSDEDYEATLRAFRSAHVANPLHRCATGDEALDFLYQRGEFAGPEPAPRPALVLLDLNLPGTDGREVLKTLKADDALKTIPVIILTTSRSNEDVQRCYELGANTYVEKPVTFEGFIEAVERLRDYWLKVAILPREQGEGQ